MTLDAITFAAGAALSAMLGLMQLRVDRGVERASGYLLLWVLGFIWTLGNFLRCTLALAGADPDSIGSRFAENLAWSCTLLGPVAIGRLLQAGIGSTSRIYRGFVAFTSGVSLLNFALLIRANHDHAWHLEASAYPKVSFFIALVVGVFAVLLFLGRGAERRRRTMPRWFAPVALGFAALHTSAILGSMLFPGMPRDLLAASDLIARHWTIPWSVLIAVCVAQAHYADLVLKRSLWLLTSTAAATLTGLFLSGASPGLPLLITVLSTTALLLAAPLLVRMLDSFVDRVILSRPDYAEASRRLDQSFWRATLPDQAIDATLDILRATLRVDACRLGASLRPSSTALASVIVKCADRSAHRIEIMATHEARTLMQRERDFLESVRLQLEHRLDAMHFESEQRALHLREERLKRLLSEAELKALRTQVDPHFLFNTLNTIADLIGANPQQAERMIERLADCFRYALAKHSQDLSTLDEELDFARRYLEIEQVRFGDRLHVQLSRGDALGSETVPSLLLQPLLENAIRHGLASVREGGCVSVQAHRDGERLHLSIEDNGVGLRGGFRPGVGLRNVQERLRTLYAQAAEFVVAARPDGRGARITIVIPLLMPPHAH